MNLSGHFETLMVALSLPVAELMAKEIHRAVHGLGTHEPTLIEILCSDTNQEIREMNAAYERSKYFLFYVTYLKSSRCFYT